MVVSKTLWLSVIVTLRQDRRDRLTTSGEPCLAIVPKGDRRGMGTAAKHGKLGGSSEVRGARGRRDGRRFTIRALRPDDRDELLTAVRRSSAQSLYRRFFFTSTRFYGRANLVLRECGFGQCVGLW